MKRKAAVGILTALCLLCLIFAFGCAQQKNYYTVTFMDGDTVVSTQQVEKGKKIESYPAVYREDEYDFLDGWCMDKELTKEWNGSVERVTKDITLWAHFLHITETPGNAAMSGEAFSNTLTWLQRAVPENPLFTVKLFESKKISRTAYEYTTEVYSKDNPAVTVENYKGESNIYKVSWMVDEKPLGGVYGAEITFDSNTYFAESLLYKGEGTQANPYLIADNTDLTAINTANVPEGAYYKVLNSFTARVSSSKIAGHTFGGSLDGNGKTVTLEASDAGLFNELTQTATITDLTVDGSIPGVSENCAGVIAATNHGSITYCNVSATVTSENGTIGTLEGGKDGIQGGAGGLVGINYGTVSNCAFTGTVQASVGAGGIAAINNGTVENCNFGGTLGAGNSTEVGTSTKKYSYMGGVVAVNYGAVKNCSAAGSGKLLAQRSASGESPNNNIGGIAALNTADGVIAECYFEGIRVHGNNNVGGIAGENAGTVAYCFAAATYQSGPKVRSYVGGYNNVGGIVGLANGGTVSNCFATCNVYAYGETAYAIAQQAQNCVYLGFNFDTREEVTTQLTAPSGENNVKIAEEAAVLEAANKSYALPATYTYLPDPDNPDGAEVYNYLAILNGELAEEELRKFADNGGVRLAVEKPSTVLTHTITVTVHGEAVAQQEITNTGTTTVALSKNTAGTAPQGKYLVGWSLIDGGEAVFGTKAVGFADLEELGLDALELYPVYADGEDPYDKILSLAVYKQYVEEDIVTALIEAFKTHCTENGIEVNEFNYTMIGSSSTSVGAFCNSVTAGDYNVMIGQRANLTITVIGNADTLLKVNGTARRIAKISEGTAADAFYNFVLNADAAKKILDPEYITEAEADKIEVTLMNGGTQYGEKLTVSNATEAAKATLPTLEAPENFNFAGWSLTAEEAEEELLLKGSVGYADLQSYAEGGKLTLYARFTEVPQIPTIVIGYWSYSNYCTQAEAQSIKTGFESYLREQNITQFEVVLQEFKDSKVANVVDSIINSSVSVDCIIGGNTNITTTSGATTQQKLEVKGKILALSNLLSKDANRKAVRLSDEELAVKLMEYLEKAEKEAAA